MESLFVPSITFYLLLLIVKIQAAADTISQFQSLSEGHTLVSNKENFELGFFTPGNSGNRYLGIWYNDISVQTVVWVANRETPLQDKSGVLMINNTQNLVLLSQNKTVVWSISITPLRKALNPVLQLLDSGNLVLREQQDQNPENYLWQSFDYPSDTLLPGMKLGKDLRTGLDRRLTAWKNENDPAPGNFTWSMEVTNWPQPMMWIGSKKYHNTGPWNGLEYSVKPTLKPNPIFDFMYFSSENEVYYMLRLWNNSLKARMVMNQTRYERDQSVWMEAEQRWMQMYTSVPRDFCDRYGACGSNGNCDERNSLAACDCLKGFKPKSSEEWSRMNYTQGCVRDGPLNCQKDGFFKYVSVNMPDTEYSWLNQSMTLTECRDKCLSNCSCAAYTNSDIKGAGSGCAMWFGNLNDLRLEPDSGQELYVRFPASESETSSGRKVKIGIAVGSTIAILSGLLLVLYFLWRRGRRATAKKNAAVMDYSREEEKELPLFDLSSIARATDNFSISNKLGEGGFGPVYKGTLNGQEIAVKRLSRGSGQGLKEFKNEITLIAKLQHRNLVRLHGCCIHDEEKLLIYEYVPNRSLDFFIFDQTKRKLLDWSKRFHIICGIARGLLYLHQDSRLRIIHRDLKVSNVLLDSEMVPRISDFGLARILEGDQIVATTHRAVGTYGYMAPEYAIDGKFSVKSDVFSFGILMLEIVSGKKNRGNHHQKESFNLIGYAWDLWTEGRPLELIDEYIKDSDLLETLRCIHISLLCLQQHPDDRPDISAVVMMLGSEIGLPRPKEPALVGVEYSYQEYLE